jgi:hypothetical protein
MLSVFLALCIDNQRAHVANQRSSTLLDTNLYWFSTDTDRASLLFTVRRCGVLLYVGEWLCVGSNCPSYYPTSPYIPKVGFTIEKPQSARYGIPEVSNTPTEGHMLTYMRTLSHTHTHHLAPSRNEQSLGEVHGSNPSEWAERFISLPSS